MPRRRTRAQRLLPQLSDWSVQELQDMIQGPVEAKEAAAPEPEVVPTRADGSPVGKHGGQGYTVGELVWKQRRCQRPMPAFKTSYRLYGHESLILWLKTLEEAYQHEQAPANQAKLDPESVPTADST